VYKSRKAKHPNLLTSNSSVLMYENMYFLLVVCIADDDDDLVEIFSMDLLFEVGIILLYIFEDFSFPYTLLYFFLPK
jgi:hypothetical protein